MRDLPLISVLVPAYNAEKWLADCCESVLRQTYSNIELIVIDDGSTDGTYDLAIGIASEDERVHVIRTENGGVCRARNMAIEAAVGEYVVFLDADDVLMHNAIEHLFAALTQEQADISVGWHRRITSDGRDAGCSRERMTGVFTGTEGLRLSLEDHPSMYAVWGKLYKRTAIGDIRFVEGRKVHEDSFFVFECLLKQPKVVICDEIVLSYRLSENSASRGHFSEKVFDILYFAEQKKRAVECAYPEFLSLAENVIVKANMALLWNLLKTDDSRYRSAEKTAIKNIRDRKAYYIPATKSDEKLFWIVTHHLYGVIKKVYSFRNHVSFSRKYTEL